MHNNNKLQQFIPNNIISVFAHEDTNNFRITKYISIIELNN